jgi:cytochrome c biogenesis protein ResB
MQTVQWEKSWFLSLPLAAVLVTSVGACTHQRFHRDLRAAHEDFHSEPHTRAEHRRFHNELEDYHEEAHDRGYFDGRADRRGSYGRREYGGGYY